MNSDAPFEIIRDPRIKRIVTAAYDIAVICGTYISLFPKLFLVRHESDPEQNAVKKQVAGMSAAMALVLGLCIMAVSFFQLRLMRNNAPD